MAVKRDIGFVGGVLVNINTIIGAGIFINLTSLLALGGSMSFAAYGVAAVIMLPIVLTLALLARHQPESGGLYVYTTTYLSPFMGFLAGWFYFAGKAISVGLMAHLLMQHAYGWISLFVTVPHLLLDGLFLATLVGLNIAGVRLQGMIQWLFVSAKGLPVLFVVGVLLAYGDPGSVKAADLSTANLLDMLPIAVFAMVGFEVSCTVAHLFKDPRRTLVPIVLTGFAIVCALLLLVQFAGSILLAGIPSPLFPLASIAMKFVPKLDALQTVLHVAVYTSMLGGAFSILTSNCWNLHRLASAGHLPGKAYLTRLTKGNVPWVSLCVEACISLIGITISQQQVSLQKMSIFGVVFAFCCVVAASFFAYDRERRLLVPALVRWPAVIGSAFLAVLTLYHLYLYGLSVPYLTLVLSGVALASYYELSGRRKSA